MSNADLCQLIRVCNFYYQLLNMVDYIGFFQILNKTMFLFPIYIHFFIMLFLQDASLNNVYLDINE